VDTDQKMDMILFTSKFFHAATLAFQNTTERSFKKAHDFRNDDFTAVFGDKDYVQPNQINSMRNEDKPACYCTL
jgi:hypothetical protein